jgi:zinc transport system ATP-binding protein
MSRAPASARPPASRTWSPDLPPREEPAAPVVRIRHGAIGYGDRPVIRDLDFELVAGEVVAVLGVNGSGKSTLIRGILGLAPFMAGTLELFGTPAPQFHARHRIGYVPQRHTVVGGIPSTVREVVSSGRLAGRGPFARMRAQDRTAVTTAIDLVRLQEKADTNVAQLSGGQQRRVLIARALAAQPDVLVLDEPTAGVDTANQVILAATLERLVTTGTTLLLVAHELGPLEPLISRVVVMRDGRKVHDGELVPADVSDPSAHAHHEADPRPRQPRLPGVGLTDKDVI